MSNLEQFIAFKATVSLLEERQMKDVITCAYRNAKRQEEHPGGRMENYVKQLYAPFSDEEIAGRIASLLTPENIHAKVQIVYQSLEGLHKACPQHRGDWYFSGDYPTEGGLRLLNKAFIEFIEKRYQF